MLLSTNSVDELKEILHKDLGKDITREQARKFGEWILKFYSHLAASEADKTNPPAKNIK